MSQICLIISFARATLSKLYSIFVSSRRQWDGLVKAWKKRLHHWDQGSETLSDSNAPENFSDLDESFEAVEK